MKTLNEKPRINQLLLIVVLLLTMNVLSVSAENQNLSYLFSDTSDQKYVVSNTANLYSYNSYNETRNTNLFLAENQNSVTVTKSTAREKTYFEVFEKEISLEDWMLSTKNSFWIDIFSVYSEDEIVIEDWMLDASKW